MKLFENEKIISSTDDNIVILTTHRVRCTNSYQWGQQSTTSIMLEKVSSIQATYISYPLLLVIAGISLVIAIGMGSQRSSQGQLSIPIIIAVVLGIIYYFTRKHVCVIASDGGAKIVFETEGVRKDRLLEFMDNVEKIKSSRIKALHVTH